MQRRKFLTLLGLTSGALAAPWDAVAAREELISRLRVDPDALPPDQSRFMRTYCSECPAACGLRVELRAGHPIKLEGDPESPIGRGGLCIRGQASLGRLYHPERVTRPLERQTDGTLTPLDWSQALARVHNALAHPRDDRAGNAAGAAAGAYIGHHATGTLAAVRREFADRRRLELFPALERFHHGALRGAYDTLFGWSDLPGLRLAGAAPADVVLTFGADLFESFLDPVTYAAEWSAAREAGATWVHLEPGLTLTGCNATQRHAITPGSEAALLAFLVLALDGAAARLPEPVRQAVPEVPIEAAARASGLRVDTLRELTEALRAARRPLTVAGGVATAQPRGRLIALLAGLLQYVTGQFGTTLDLERTENLEALGGFAEIEARASALAAADLGVCFLAQVPSLTGLPETAALLERTPLAVGLTDFLYPAYAHCDLILPLAHTLEAASDAEPRRGLHVRGAPLFQPLADTRAEGAILLALLGANASWDERIDRHWRERRLDPVAGPIVSRAVSRRPTRLRAEVAAALREAAEEAGLDRAAAVAEAAADDAAGETVLLIGPSVRMHDGRSRPITLLQEIPDPIATVTYGDYLLVSEAFAARQALADGDHLRLETPAGTLERPVRVQPGQPAGVVTLPIEQLPQEAWAAPVDPATGELQRLLRPARVSATGGHTPLAILAGSLDADGRGILPGDTAHGHGAGHGATAGHGAGHPAEAEHGSGYEEPTGDAAAGQTAPPARTLYPPVEHKHYRWAMAIDLDRCTGCSACVAACYVENNVPIVGLEEQLKGREMSWLRIQPYRDGERPLTHIPMLCQHCTYAPCETVCPVYATYHNPEGLNAQIYNRCVGTRYCANNCPYKARRFNWFAHDRAAPLDLMLNPDVSVRPKGVMEKCTFCIQRIRDAKDRAKDEGRRVRDGEVTPACAQSCPTQAIVFGNLLDPDSRVRAWVESSRSYRVLADLGTEPAVHYLHGDQRHES